MMQQADLSALSNKERQEVGDVRNLSTYWKALGAYTPSAFQ